MFDGVVCVCVCVPMTKHAYIFVEEALREISFFKVRGGSNGMNEPAQRRAPLFVLGIEFWWLEN